MSEAAFAWALRATTGSPTAKAVLFDLALAADGLGFVWRSQRQVSATTELTERSVRTALAGLEVRGLIERHGRRDARGHRACDLIVLALPSDTLDAAGLCESIQVVADPLSPARPYGVTGSEWAALRKAVFDRDRFGCTYCGSNSGPLHCDHVVPWSRGGETILENLTTACAPCNVGKKDRSADDWRAVLKGRSSAPVGTRDPTEASDV